MGVLIKGNMTADALKRCTAVDPDKRDRNVNEDSTLLF